MKVRVFAGVFSAIIVLSGCMTEIQGPPTVPTAAVVPAAPPAAQPPPPPPAAPPAAAPAPAQDPGAPSGFLAEIDCNNPAPEDVAVCNGN